MSADHPEGYVPYEAVRASLPAPERVAVSRDVSLETLHVPGPGPTLVFVHGGLGSLWNPYPQLAAFAGKRGLVTYSLAGNRNSSDRPEHTLDGHVSDLVGLLDELGVEQPVVHGHSYGSTVAIEFAKRQPVAGLAIVGGGDHELAAAFERPLLFLLGTLGLYRLPGMSALDRRLTARVACHPETPSTVTREFSEANPLPRRRSAYEAPRAFRGYDGRDDIDDIESPALVVHGTGDDVVSADVARGTARRLPDAVFCRLDRAGHLPFVERPAAYNDLLRSLLEASQDDRRLIEAIEERTDDDVAPSATC